MAEQQEQLEMEVEVDTEVEVEASEEQSDQENVEIVEEDQFDKAQSSTQKRIDRLTKRCETHSVARKRLLNTQNRFRKSLRN